MAEPSPARPRRAGPRRGYLPAEVSAFIGRRQELRQLLTLQPTHRLVTLVGPGGVGKTRLAVRLAAQRARAYAHGVWFTDLGPLAEVGLVPDAVARTLALTSVDQSSRQALTDYLRARRILLLLDTCDRNVAASADLAENLLRNCPGVDIVATSRQPLGLADELVWRVPPLAVAGSHVSQLRQLRSSEAHQLFLARARAALPNFGQRDDNAVVVAGICRSVDGLPLAVELVAAHAARLGLNELAARVDSSFVLGLAGSRGAPPRQQTLRASLDWSYELLTDPQKLLFRRLAVFAGGWTSAAAAAVCADDRLSGVSVVNFLPSLVEKSLVLDSTTVQPSKYRLPNITRQYGLELLRAHDELGRLQRRHLEWMLALAEQVPPEVLDTEHTNRLERERDNLRAALDFALAAGEAEIGLRIATAALPLWFFRSQYAEGHAWLDRLLARNADSVAPRVSAAARTWRAQLMILQGEYAAAEADIQKVIDEQRTRGDNAGLATSQMVLGNAALWRGALDSADRAYQAAVDQMAEPNHIVDIVRYQSARIAWETGDLEGARVLADRVVEMGVTRPGFIAVARAKQIHALLAAEAGDTDTALRLLGDAQRQQRRIGHQHGVIDTLVDGAQVLLASDRPEQAQTRFAQAARLADAAGAHTRLMRAMEGISRVMVLTQPTLAVQLASAAAASRAATNAQLWPRDKRLLEESLAVARTQLGADAYAHAWQTGALMLESEAVALALSAASAHVAPGSPTRPANITPREWEVVRLLASGASNMEIAERLVISPATVRTHLDRVQVKLGLHSRVQLATWGIESASLRDA